MNSQDYRNFERTSIPDVFYSSETGEPFASCMMCNKSLLEESTNYIVEKVVRQIQELNFKEVLFEYALCLDCIVLMNESLSKESQQKIQRYILKHVDMVGRCEKMRAEKYHDVKPWISHCLIKGTPIAESSEFQIMAQCEGKNLLLSDMPLALSLEAMDEMSELLSERSRGEMGDFRSKFFSGPPEIEEWLKKRPLIFT